MGQSLWVALPSHTRPKKAADLAPSCLMHWSGMCPGRVACSSPSYTQRPANSSCSLQTGKRALLQLQPKLSLRSACTSLLCSPLTQQKYKAPCQWVYRGSASPLRSTISSRIQGSRCIPGHSAGLGEEFFNILNLLLKGRQFHCRSGRETA